MLENVVWLRPISVADDPIRVHVGLTPGENGTIAYEIYSRPGETNEEPVLHGQGSALLKTFAEAPALDMESLKAECDRRRYSSDECYEAFAGIGLEYGDGHRGIQKIYVGDRRALVRLALPDSVFDTADRFVLHPSLADSALQATMALDLLARKSRSAIHEPFLPFALERMEIFGGCAPSMWALVRLGGRRSADDGKGKFDIDLYDEKGAVCARMRGFSKRMSKERPRSATVCPDIPGTPPAGAVLLAPAWKPFDARQTESSPSGGERVWVVGGGEIAQREMSRRYPDAGIFTFHRGIAIEEIAEKLKKHGRADHVIWIAPSGPATSAGPDAWIEEQETGVVPLFRMIKAALRLEYGSRSLGWTIITFAAQSLLKEEPVNPGHASIHGLVGSMAKEHPDWRVRLVDLESENRLSDVDVFGLPPDPSGNALVYRDRSWLLEELVPVRDFEPELLLISCGFDTHKRDPLGTQELESETFGEMTRKVKRLAGGRIVSALEGGYDLEALAEGSVEHVKALQED